MFVYNYGPVIRWHDMFGLGKKMLKKKEKKKKKKTEIYYLFLLYSFKLIIVHYDCVIDFRPVRLLCSHKHKQNQNNFEIIFFRSNLFFVQSIIQDL